MTKHTIERLLRRVEKGGEIESHRHVFLNDLAAFENAPAVVDQLFSDIGEELSEVLPEQRQEVVRKIDTQKLLEELCQK